ncbi:MAG: alpha/beta fold hydrolase [Bacteroidota bacterium]
MELNYKVFGQGPPVIILHGLLGMLDNWQSIARKLADDFTVFIVDQRNHGKSPHTTELSYELMAEDLRVFMEEHWIYGAHIIGHSMGGKTAMYFTIANPDMVEKLIVVDINITQSKPGHQDIFDALFSINPPALSSRKEADSQLETLIPDFGVRQFLLKNIGRDSEGQLTWKMNLQGIYDNYVNILAAVPSDEPFDGETLFIRGGRSDYLSENDIEGIQTIFTNAKMETIEEAGHWVHAEQPVQFLESVQNFLMV